MLKQWIPIFFGVVLTSLSFLALPLQEVQIYAEPLGVWAFALACLPAALGIVISVFIKDTRPKNDLPKPAGIVILHIGSEPVMKKVLDAGKTITFGSAAEDGLRVQMPSIKPSQLLIKVKKDVCYVTNISCLYGAHLNRQNMPLNKQFSVYAGDVVQMGKIKIKFEED